MKKIIVYSHPDCLLKDNGPNHPEKKERLQIILKSIQDICCIDIEIKDDGAVGLGPDDDLPFSKGGRVQKQEGGTTEDQMNALAISVAPARVEEQETHTMPDGTVMPGATHEEYEQMLPDEEMEEDYVDYIVESALD